MVREYFCNFFFWQPLCSLKATYSESIWTSEFKSHSKYAGCCRFSSNSGCKWNRFGESDRSPSHHHNSSTLALCKRPAQLIEHRTEQLFYQIHLLKIVPKMRSVSEKIFESIHTSRVKCVDMHPVLPWAVPRHWTKRQCENLVFFQPLRLDIKRKLSARSDRVKCVDLHPSEPWMLASLYNGNVHIWNSESQVNGEISCVCVENQCPPSCHKIKARSCGTCLLAS